MSFASLLTQRCTIARKTVVKDAYKLTSVTYTVLYEDVPCRIEYQFVTSAFLTQTPNGQIRGNDYIGYFLPDADIQEGDRVTWQSRNIYVRPLTPIFDSTVLHHLEVPMGLQET
jgi:hypothetical protein